MASATRWLKPSNSTLLVDMTRPQLLGAEPPRLQAREDGVGARGAQPGTGLGHERLDGAVAEDHRVALRALPHAEPGGVECQADGAREVTVAVGEHPHLAAGAA